MKIAIIARGLSDKIGGAGQYLREMLAIMPTLRPDYEFIFIYDSKKFVGSYAAPNVTEKVLSPLPFIPRFGEKFVWDHIQLSLFLPSLGADVVFAPKNFLPIFYKGKSVVTILDMAYFLPGINAYKRFETIYHKFVMPISARQATYLAPISKNTRNDIYTLIKGVDNTKAIPVHLNGRYNYAGQEYDSGALRKKLGIPEGKFIFLASSLSPRKNIERAIQALGKAKDSIEHKFVITGGKVWGKNRVTNLISELGLEDRFVKLGYIEDEDLPLLFAEADVYFHPSLYEGFGMTILEAMHAGLPVAASNAGSHPEVVGDAGLMFDPYDVDEMAEQLVKICNDDDLRTELINKAKQHVKNFTWEKTAEETLVLMERSADE